MNGHTYKQSIFIKVIDNENEMHFKTYLKGQNTAYIRMTATTTVVKGHLIEILNNDKTYVEGETVVYFANSCMSQLAKLIQSIM
jgi:hypothetical protein